MSVTGDTLTPVPHAGLDESLTQTLRTEDARFSPSGRVLAVVATNGSISLLVVDVSSRPIRIARCTELRSSSFKAPHGIDFLSEDLIVVANRNAWVTFYRLPSVSTWGDHLDLEPIHEMTTPWFGPRGATRDLEGRRVLCGPGSVRLSKDRLFVCCNNANTVTAHPYRVRDGHVETGEGEVVAQAGLEIPDGVAVTRRGDWLAISNHHGHGVMVRSLDDPTRAGLLRDAGLHYPHGLCFDPTGRALYVADAGEREVHVFFSADGAWDRSTESSGFKLAAVDADAFRKTKEDSVDEKLRRLEGGIKGIDIDSSGRLLVTTCRHQMLRFFEVARAAVDGSSGTARA